MVKEKIRTQLEEEVKKYLSNPSGLENIFIDELSNKVIIGIGANYKDEENSVIIHCWYNHDEQAGKNAAGRYLFPQEFDLFYDNMEYIVNGGYVCCDCRKKVNDFKELHWRMFAALLCEKCNKEYDDSDISTEGD